ncbi:hypothetical protein [Synechococcus sp. MVIR-18-1]|uniref:hypothetical protein n=1 Tax=Synechococcus sp. MVIR-18-1 TaxID=1386941 RepID=UPI0016485EA6|nr:hypothetical protein [Synechococcus sp. MVIR-18-1]
MEDFETPFGNAMLESFDGVNKQSTLDARVKNLKGVGNLVEVDFGSHYKEEFDEIADKASQKVVEPSQELGRYLKPENAFEHFESILNPSGRALQCLAYIAGLTPNDLLRELNDLQFLKDGVAVIGEKLNQENPSPRSVKFDPDWLNQLDPNGEVIENIQNIVGKVTADNAGDLANDLTNYYAGSGYTINDLRNCHAINLFNEGYLMQEIAEIQGVEKSWLRSRVANFKRKAGL